MKDSSKTDRILWLYDGLLRGHAVRKENWADEHGVSVRSVQRDILTIREYLEARREMLGENVELKYDREKQVYSFSNPENRFLSEGELFEICKILIESRAFKKKDLESLLARLLGSVMSDEAKARIGGQINNELFNYVDPKHEKVDPDVLWLIAEAEKNSRVLEIVYYKMSTDEEVTRRIRPVGILFSEYYFYLMGIIDNDWGKENFEKNGPVIYRIDRIRNIRDTGDTFSLPYGKRFKEGEYKNRVQFMYGGSNSFVQFKYYGPSIEAVLDRLPTARIMKEEGGVFTVTADIAGTGILMWLLSQGSMVEVLAPQKLRDDWLAEVRAILSRAEKQ